MALPQLHDFPSFFFKNTEGMERGRESKEGRNALNIKTFSFCRWSLLISLSSKSENLHCFFLKSMKSALFFSFNVLIFYIWGGLPLTAMYVGDNGGSWAFLFMNYIFINLIWGKEIWGRRWPSQLLAQIVGGVGLKPSQASPTPLLLGILGLWYRCWDFSIQNPQMLYCVF